MAMNLVRRWAAAGPVPLYVVIGRGMRDAVDDLLLLPGLKRVDTPRAAGVLLVAGALPDENTRALQRLHDQLPHPRATLWWRATPLKGFVHAASRLDTDAQDVARCLAELHARLLRDPASSESDCLPNEPPAPWDGLGEHGQGGERMMGGKPYGRAMAMTGEDLRDGLQLDAFQLRLGPFAPMLPPGMVLELTLQGDVIQQAAVRQLPFPQPRPATPRSFLRCAARMLDLLELPALAERCCRSARREGGPDAALLRTVRWSGALAAVPAGLGRVEALGTDARERLEAWLAGTGSDHDVEASLDVLLPGLEWQEAMLVIASLDGVRFALTGGGEPNMGAHGMSGQAHDMHADAPHAHHAHGGHG